MDAAIAALGARQHAVFGLDQLRELGLTANAVQQRAAEGRLHRVHRTVYSLVPPALLTRNGRYMAAVLACGAGALLSHRCAAPLHDLLPTGASKIEVTVPGRGMRRHAGLAVHRSTTLTPADATVVDNIPSTSVARTLFDLAEVVPRRRVERAFDQAEVLQVFDLRALNDQLARNPTRPAARIVRAVLVEYDVGSSLTQSELEEAMLALSRAVGLPPPEVNNWLDLGDGGSMIKPDFMWRSHRLILEVDSRKYHMTSARFEHDRRSDQRALVAGWRVIRTTYRQINHRPAELHDTLTAAIAGTRVSFRP